MLLSNRRNICMIVLLLFSLVLMPGCSKSDAPGVSPDDGKAQTRASIDDVLKSTSDVGAITWAPDESMVLYTQKVKAEGSDSKTVMAWKLNETQAKSITEVSPGFMAFNWSSDSKHFLISENSGEGVINRIFAAEQLAETYKFNSLDVPVWNKNGNALVFGFEHHDYGESWGSLRIYRLGQTKPELIWNTRNYLYKAESWDDKGNIGYTEIDDQGQSSHKTTRNIKPAISGLHLGDSKAQMIAALGSADKETPPSDETMSFPEPVYHYSYQEGYEVFIGQNSREVLEILAQRPGAETNLGVGVGDTASNVFEVYRGKYMEPESIHGGKLYGVFKVEGAAALAFHFDNGLGMTRDDINPDSKVTGITLTYPNNMDDDF